MIKKVRKVFAFNHFISNESEAEEELDRKKEVFLQKFKIISFSIEQGNNVGQTKVIKRFEPKSERETNVGTGD